MWISFHVCPLFLLVTLQEIDVRAGGGKPITIGELCRHFIERLEWFDTRFPRIPVNVQVCKLQNCCSASANTCDAQMFVHLQRDIQKEMAELFPSGSAKPSVIMDRIAATSEEGSKAPPKARREEDAIEGGSSRPRTRSRSPRSSDRRRSRSRDRKHKRRSRSRSR